jgi:hypothetical protein
VTSRSNPEVVELCNSFPSEAVCWRQHVPIEEVELGIGTYLKAKLPMLASSSKLAGLGYRAGGLFIFAATAVKHLTPHPSVTFREQSKMLGDLLSNSYKSGSTSDATFLIDELYRQIMYDTFAKFKGEYLTYPLFLLVYG